LLSRRWPAPRPWSARVFLLTNTLPSSSPVAMLSTAVCLRPQPRQWAFSIAKSSAATTRTTRTASVRKKREAGDAPQVSLTAMSFLSSLRPRQPSRYRFQATASESMAAYSYPKDRPAYTFHHWYYIRPNRRPARVGKQLGVLFHSFLIHLLNISAHTCPSCSCCMSFGN